LKIAFGDWLALAANSPKIRGRFDDHFNQYDGLSVTHGAAAPGGCGRRRDRRAAAW
jgi:hypothetical protein